MTTPEIKAFIAEMKLRELQRYRARLHGLYDAMEAQAAAAPTPIAALDALATGLAEVEVAGRRVHPEVGNLQAVLLADANDDDAAAGLVADWTARLRATIGQGRARADAITLFGGLLGEQLGAPPVQAPTGLVETACAQARSSRDARVDVPALEAALDAAVDPAERAHLRQLAASLSDELLTGFADLDGVVQALASDPASPRAWRQALAPLLKVDPQTLLPPAAMGELQSAVRILQEDLADWDWRGPVRLEATWTRNRWRVRVLPGLIDMIVAEVIGQGLLRLVQSLGGASRRSRALRLARLRELNAPAIIMENEQRMLTETGDLAGSTWIGGQRSPLDPLAIDLGEPDSALRQILSQLAEMGISGAAGYGGEGYGGDATVARAIAAVHARLELASATTDGPPVVVRADVEDFYAAVPHALPLALLRWLGVDHRVLDLTRRLLSPPLDDGQRLLTGLPLGLTVSRALGELVMITLERLTRSAAPIDIVRLVDDVVLLAPNADAGRAAWDALSAGTRAAGLALHTGKAGTFGLDDPEAHGLPPGPVRWGLLELHPRTRWRVADDALEVAMRTARERVEAHTALLDQVSAWREQLRYLLTWLAPAARLDDDHPNRVRLAVRRFVSMPLTGGDGRLHRGMTALLRAELGRRFVGGAPVDLPDAWLHWPVTAGGLALPYPPASLVPLEIARQRHEPAAPPEAPATLQHALHDPRWGTWFATLQTIHSAWAPEETPHSRAMVEDFIARGRKVRSDAHDGLATHWRWTLATFGPAIVERFGSYDFIDTDLVPLDVIGGGLEV